MGDTSCTATRPPHVSLIPFNPKGLWPSERPEPVRGPVRRQGSGPSGVQTRWTQQDGIRIPSNFLTVGWVSRQQAEHACFLHMLVRCSLPRAEVIQKTPRSPAPSPGKPAPSGSRIPDRAAKSQCPPSLRGNRQGGLQGSMNRRGRLSSYTPAHLPEAGGCTARRSKPVLQPLQLGSGGIRLEALPSASIPREGMQAKSEVNRAS